MTAEVIYLIPEEEYLGNGALELMESYFEQHYPEQMAAGIYGDTELTDAEHFLAWLACEGYVIVPFDEDVSA